jgi:ABC-type polar amino acid transport system ATPase subunit
MKADPQKEQRAGDPTNDPARPNPASSRPALRISGLTKRIEDHDALNGVDFAVDSGEVAAIIGPSGAGKTTLLRCIALLTLPDAGRIELFGTMIFNEQSLSSNGRATDLRAAHRDVLAQVGVVFQSLNLWPHRTVLQNVADPLVRVRGLSRREADEKAAAQLEELGLSGKLSRRPDTLSGGEKQRVALARALVGKPDLLLLDEITSALDLERVAELLILLRRLAKSAITLVIVTHELSFATEVAQQVVFMEGGRVVEVGRPRDVLKNPRSTRVREFLSRVSEGFNLAINNGSGQ